MTTLVTGDLHLSDNPRDEYRFKFLNQTLPELIAQGKTDRLLILGDLTEAKDGHQATLVNRIVDGLARLSSSVPITILKGNHDYRRADTPFFRFLDHLPNVRWVNEPTPLKLRGLGHCIFLPHAPDWQEEWADYIADGGIADGSYDWIFCHQTFGKADLGHGHKACGEAAPFRRDARVVSGDVHVPQRAGVVNYVGAPYSVDFGDDYEPRVLLLNGTKMKSVPVPGPQKRALRVEWPAIPNLAAPAAVFSVAPDAADGTIQPGDVVKVIVELPAGAEASRSAVRQAAQEWVAQAGVTLHAVQVVAPAAQAAAKLAERDRHRQSDGDLVRAYAKRMGKGKATVAAGLKITEETT